MFFYVHFKKYRSEIEATIQWYKNLNIRTTKPSRLDNLSDSLSKLFDYYNEQTNKFHTDTPASLLFYVAYDTHSFSYIYNIFSKFNQNHLPKKTLKDSITGPDFIYEEDSEISNVQARNAQYELELAANLIEAGFKAVNFEDFSFECNEFTVSIQCKRPTTHKTVKSNVEKAYNQLKNNNNLNDLNRRGLIALSVEKVLGLDTKILRINTNDEINSFIATQAIEFKKKYQSSWNSISNKNLIGIILTFKIMTFNEIDNTYINSYLTVGIPLFSNSILDSANKVIFSKIMKAFQ